MDHMSDAEVLEGVQQGLRSMPASAVAAIHDAGLVRLQAVLARLSGIASATKQ